MKLHQNKARTSVRAPRLVGLRVPLNPESKLVVPVPPGPLCLRPEDTTAEPVRSTYVGLLRKSVHGGSKTADKTLQKQCIHVYLHVGLSRKRKSQANRIKKLEKETKKAADESTPPPKKKQKTPEMSTNYNGDQQKATGTIPVRSSRGPSARLKFDGCLWRAECSAAMCSCECCVDVCGGETPCAYLPISRIPLTRGEGMAKLKLRTQH